MLKDRGRGKGKASGDFVVGDHVTFTYRGDAFVGRITVCAPYRNYGTYEVEAVRTNRREKRTRRFQVDGNILTKVMT